MTLIADRQKWNLRYEGDPPARPEPHPMARRWQARMIPGRMLDAACGLGRGIASAPAGFDTIYAVDISDVALRKARTLWFERSGIRWIAADVTALAIPAGFFSLVCAFGFTDWNFMRSLGRLLCPGGMMLYEGFSRRQLERRPGLNPDWTATPQDLREEFNPWEILECAESASPPFRSRLAAIHPPN